MQEARRASAAATAGPGPDSSALLPAPRPPRRSSARLKRGGGRSGAGAGAGESLVRLSDVAPCVSCGICGGLLRDAAAFSVCLDAFCRKCIYDKCAKENIRSCPTCGIHLGRSPLEKLRSVIFPSKRRKVGTINKTKEMVSAELCLSSVVDVTVQGSTSPMTPGSPLSKAQKIEVEVIDEPDDALVTTLNLAPVGRDALSRIRCRDTYSACSLSAETGALIVWQKPPNLEEMVANQQGWIQRGDWSPPYPHAAHGAPPKPPLEILAMGKEEEEEKEDEEEEKEGREEDQSPLDPSSGSAPANQLVPRQDPLTFGPPATSDTEYLGQALTVQMTNISVLAGSSFHTTMTDDEKLTEDTDAIFKEFRARTRDRYGARINQLKAENSKLQEELEEERERRRTLEERHQRELANEREAAAERTRILKESHEIDLDREREAVVVSMRIMEERARRESQIAMSFRSQKQSLEAENARLYEELENGRADNQALMSDISEKCEELATLKYYSDKAESENTYLENQLEHLKNELDRAKKEHARYVRQVLDAARAIPNDLETIHSDAEV